jgi:hypothetical protein
MNGGGKDYIWLAENNMGTTNTTTTATTTIAPTHGHDKYYNNSNNDCRLPVTIYVLLRVGWVGGRSVVPHRSWQK